MTAGSGSAGRNAFAILDVVLKPALVGVVVPIAGLAIALAVIRPGFYSAYTIQSNLTQAAIFAVVGLAQLTVIAIGQMNLALPAMAACAAMTAGFLMQAAHVPVPLALVAGVLVAGALGAGQGGLIGYARLNPFIVTLGLGSLYLGAMFAVIRGASYSAFPEDFFAISRIRPIGIPLITLMAIACVLVMVVVYRRSVSGREMLAVGASLRAARYSGIAVPANVLKAHTLSGLLAGVAAILAMADLGAADSSLGQAWLLPSFAAPVLGGALLLGGRVSSLGTALGAVLLVLVNTALVVMGVNQYWYQVGLGVVLLLSVLLGRAREQYMVARSVR